MCTQSAGSGNSYGAAVFHYGSGNDSGAGSTESVRLHCCGFIFCVKQSGAAGVAAFLRNGVTMATYCAQNRGVNDLDRIQKGVKIANIMSAIYAVVIYGVIYLVLPYIIGLFVAGDIGEVYGYARTFVIICGAFFIPLGMIFIFRNALQGCGFGFLPMMGGVVELVSRSAMAFVAARLLSYEGVCMANVAAWSSAGIFLWIAYRILMKKMIQSKAAFCGESEHAQIEALHQTRTGRNPV